MRISKIVAAVAALGLAFSTSAFAGSGGGKVNQVLAVQGGVVIFQTASHTNAPICASIPLDWAINTTTAQGKAEYALLLTAVNGGKSITVSGANTCDAWGDRETAAQIIVNF